MKTSLILSGRVNHFLFWAATALSPYFAAKQHDVVGAGCLDLSILTHYGIFAKLLNISVLQYPYLETGKNTL